MSTVLKEIKFIKQFHFFEDSDFVVSEIHLLEYIRECILSI